MPSTNAESTVTERGQTAIPARIRRRLGLKSGQKLSWVENGSMISLIPSCEDPIQAFRGSGFRLPIISLTRRGWCVIWKDSAGAGTVRGEIGFGVKCFSTWAVFDLMKKYMDGTTSSSSMRRGWGRKSLAKKFTPTASPGPLRNRAVRPWPQRLSLIPCRNWNGFCRRFKGLPWASGEPGGEPFPF
jgi:AbrB family looped-hinge helix DNA binding protein